jgi:hypothetical protein
MADIVITSTSVVRDSSAEQPTHGILGATVTAGQGVVQDPTSKLFVPADSNHATAALRAPDGIALNGGAINQPVAVHKKGRITIGGTVVAGTIYVQSDNPGGIAPAADLGAGETVTIIGVGASATQIDVNINKSGIQV